MTKLHRHLFLIFALIFVLSTFLKPYPLSWLVKLLPLAVLIHFSFGQTKNDPGVAKWLFTLGLVFSACGDFFLDYDSVNWFVFGLGSFLIAHLCYIISLKPFSMKRLAIVAIYSLYGVSMFSLIYGGLGELFVPVFIYMTVLLLMGIATLLSEKSNTWLIIGGISFIISDSLLGINKFYHQIPYASLSVMLTYYLAQFSLVNGMFAPGLKTATSDRPTSQ